MDHQDHNSVTLPYIGSRISLISNAEIRYEGILYSINTFESTVALQNVRSFGTEGRRVPEVLPQNKTYQFIVFKGRDIKDLTVCEPANQIDEDPAIVNVNVPPINPSVMAQKSQAQAPPPYPRVGIMMGQNDGMIGSGHSGGGAGNVGGHGGSYDPSGAAHRYGGFPGRMAGGPVHPNTPLIPGYPLDRGMMPGGGGMPNHRGEGRGRGMFYGGSSRGNEAYQNMRQSYHNFNEIENIDPMIMGGGRGGNLGRLGGVNVSANKLPGGVAPMRPGGVNRPGAPPTSRRTPRRIVGELPAQPNNATKKELSKAFDFEGSNAKFDKSEVAKAEPKDGAASKVNNNNPAGTVTSTTSSVTVRGYDKTTSFFDTISCEALDRQTGQDARMDRDKQRQLDCETFGAAAAEPRVPRFRGSYRRGGRGRRTPGAGYRQPTTAQATVGRADYAEMQTTTETTTTPAMIAVSTSA